MRGLALVAVLLVGALALSGCSSKDNSTSSSSTSKTSTRTGGVGGNGTKTNTTSLPPNVPPIIVLHVTNATGVATNVTFVNGSLTFSAAGSSDPDGDGLSAMAIVAQDYNRTYPPGVLYAAGKFTPVTYKFNTPGIVNVTVSAIDVRGDLTSLKAQVYVDSIQTIKSKAISAPSGGISNDAKDCTGPTSTDLVNPLFYDQQPLNNVLKGATLLTGHLVSGKGHYAFCGPDGTAVSDDDTNGDLKSNKPLPPENGVKQYNVGFVATDPQANILTVTVIVHYEPVAAAA